MLNLCKTLSKKHTKEKERNKLFIWKKVIDLMIFHKIPEKQSSLLLRKQYPITINIHLLIFFF